MKRNDVVKIKSGIIGVIAFSNNGRVVVQDENDMTHWVYESEVTLSDEPLYIEIEDVDCLCNYCGGSGRITEQRSFVTRKEN